MSLLRRVKNWLNDKIAAKLLASAARKLIIILGTFLIATDKEGLGLLGEFLNEHAEVLSVDVTAYVLIGSAFLWGWTEKFSVRKKAKEEYREILHDFLPEDKSWVEDVDVKQGVYLHRLKPEALIALRVAKKVYAQYGFKLVVTSTYDPAPGRLPHSLHPKDLAFDTRVWGMTRKAQQKVAGEAASILGSDYDIIVKSNHIHWEYDPKTEPDVQVV